MKIKDLSLYLVTGEECSNGRTTLEVAQEAIAGGIDIIQLREKEKSKDELTNLGKQLSRLCKEKGVIFILNDDPYLTKELDADGVHLGQEDMPVEKAREIIGKDKIIGISTHSLAQIEAANNLDVDYIAYGPVFETKTKDYFLGTNEIPEILKTARKPLVFIGGINFDNIDSLLKLGARNVAAIRAITQSENIKERVIEFKNKLGEKA